MENIQENCYEIWSWAGDIDVLTKYYEIDLQEVEGQDKSIVVKLTYDALTLKRPSRVDFLTEGE